MIPNGRHIYAKAYYMEKAKTFCAYPQLDHSLPHWKFVLQCCAKFTCVNLPDQETDDQYSDTTISIIFHIYCLTERCTEHGKILLNERENFACVDRIQLQNNPHKYTLEKS